MGTKVDLPRLQRVGVQASAVRRAFAEYRDALGQHVEIEEPIDAGDQVVTRCRSEVRGDHSGVEGELRLSMVHTFRNGLMVMLEAFSGHVDALRAAGLSPPGCRSRHHKGASLEPRA